jgi:hypothetical protein
MGNLISFVSLLLIAASGFLTIYLVVDFFEHLKKYHSVVWEKLCFEKPFGIPQKDFILYPVKPLKIIPFLVSSDDPLDSDIAGYKKRIKNSLVGFVAVFLLNCIIRVFI